MHLGGAHDTEPAFFSLTAIPDVAWQEGCVPAPACMAVRRNSKSPQVFHVGGSNSFLSY